MPSPSWSNVDRRRAAWWLVALALGAVLAFVVVAFIGTFMLGLFLYYSTRPIHRRVNSRVRQPSVAAAVSLFALGLPIVLLVAYTLVVGLQELGNVVSQSGGTVAELLEPYVDISAAFRDPRQVLETLIENPEQLTQLQGADIVGNLFASVTGASVFVLGAALQLFIALAFAFYLLRDDQRFAGWFQREFSGGETAADRFFEVVDRDLKTVYFGNILNAFAVAVIGTVSYNALNLFAPAGFGIPSPTLIGLLAGAGSLVPVVGMKIVYVPVALLLVAQALVTDPALLWVGVAFFLISLVVVDTIPDILLRPYVSGRNLHTGTVMFAYILGPTLFGWYGLFLGPLLLVLIVHFVRIILPSLVRGESLVPQGEAPDPLIAAESDGDEDATGTVGKGSRDRGSGSGADPDVARPDGVESADERATDTGERTADDRVDESRSGGGSRSPDSED